MKIALIDLSGVFRMFWHAGEQDEVSEARRRTVQAVASYVGDYDHVAVCIDMPPYKRKDIDPEYKAHREKAPAVMHEELALSIEEIAREGYRVLGAQGYEADDIIATVCEWTESQGHECTIYSSDKDLLQLVTPNTSVISTATRQKYEERDVEQKWGVGPAYIHDMLSLIGDKSDNVQGVKGVGPKTAAKWLIEYGSLEGVLLNADKLGRFADAVESGKDMIGKACLLTQLMRNAPINPEDILNPVERQTTEPEQGYEEMEAETSPETTIQQTDEPEVIDAPATQPEAPKPQGLVEYQQTAWDRSLEPRDPRQAWGVAKMLHQSKLFGNFPNPEAILAILMTGRSFSMDATSSLRGFHVIKGKVSPSSQLMIGLVKRHGSCVYFKFVDGDDQSATWETQRKGEPDPTKLVYTMNDAKMAGLTSNDNWKKRPKTMLRWRCGVELARLVYPDVTSGLYTQDEIEDMG